MTAPFALLGIDVGGLVSDVLRKLLDLLVPDFGAHWAAHLVTWLVALPDVASDQQFAHLNAFRVGLTHAAWGVLSLTFVAGGLQFWAAGFTDGRSAGGLEAVRRVALAAAGLVAYPTAMTQGILAVNQLTAVAIKHPLVIDGLDTALGGALALGVVSSGLTLGLAIGAVMAAVFFLAA